MTNDSLGSKIWLNGEILSVDDGMVNLSDRGLTLGDGLFETLFWTGQTLRFFDAHMARLNGAARALEIPLPFTPQKIASGLAGLTAEANGVSAAVRLTLTRGIGARGLPFPQKTKPQMFATIAPFSPQTTAISVTCVDIVRASGAPSSRFKTLSYLDNVMAHHQARGLGFDEALMRGSHGQLACASNANLLLDIDGQILTPRVEDGALPGIIRSQLLARNLIQEARLEPSDLALCQHAALTNALHGVRPIHRIENRTLPVSDDWLNRLSNHLYT
jgi:branched-chain amino acid aminotransferase